MIKTIFYVAVGGAIGSVLRFLTSFFLNKYWSNNFPLATFLTNIVGCFLIGFFIGFLEKHNVTNSDLKWILITGFCGGFTTFSAFSHESVTLFQSQNIFLALLYIVASIFLGISALWLGLLVVK